jgi:hypothetical protein
MECSAHRKPILIIPACGNSQRFKDVGIQTPKGLIKFSFGGVVKTMIEHVVPNLDLRTIVVTTDSQCSEFQKTLPKGIGVWSIRNSLGQLDTVLQALSSGGIPEDQQIIIINCDDKFPREIIQELINLDADCGTVVFKTEPNNRYGYIDGFPYFERGAEKQPISSYALAGAFMFRNKQVFENAVYSQENKWVGTNGEHYLSHLFEYIKGKKQAVLCKREEIVDFGTPDSLSFAIGNDIVELNRKGETQ